MFRPIVILACALAIFLPGCTPTGQPHYLSAANQPLDELPEISRLLVMKSKRKLYLLHDGEVIRAYDIDLGRTPVGDKEEQGDGKTPEGSYVIDRRNPQSRFYRSLGISYPNQADTAEARRKGRNPGGDIFIHGEAAWSAYTGTDWTQGCIALPDKDMTEIFALVDVGTPIEIRP